ncbi:Uncharacterised protein [Bordetella pertussis]|nr:Uncharacterised protein [Bordetella pertussis]
MPIRLSSRRPSATASACMPSAPLSGACRRMSVPAPCHAPTRSASHSPSASGA